MNDERMAAVKAAEGNLEKAHQALEDAVKAAFPAGTRVKCSVAGREQVYPVDKVSPLDGTCLVLKTTNGYVTRSYTRVEIAE